jgi:hypothetical protein
MSQHQILQSILSALSAIVAFFIANPLAAIIIVAIIAALIDPILIVIILVAAIVWFFSTHPTH